MLSQSRNSVCQSAGKGDYQSGSKELFASLKMQSFAGGMNGLNSAQVSPKKIPGGMNGVNRAGG